MNARLKLVEPCNENRQVGQRPPVRPPNADLRSREYLTPAEIERLVKAAILGRWGRRDATLITVAYPGDIPQVGGPAAPLAPGPF